MVPVKLILTIWQENYWSWWSGNSSTGTWIRQCRSVRPYSELYCLPKETGTPAYEALYLCLEVEATQTDSHSVHHDCFRLWHFHAIMIVYFLLFLAILSKAYPFLLHFIINDKIKDPKIIWNLFSFLSSVFVVPIPVVVLKYYRQAQSLLQISAIWSFFVCVSCKQEEIFVASITFSLLLRSWWSKIQWIYQEYEEKVRHHQILE